MTIEVGRADADASAQESAGDKPELDVAVVKFDAQVLRSVRDLPKTVTELYRYARLGQKVVAVVGAFEGETDALINEAQQIGGTATRHLPKLAGIGEARTAASLALSCDQAGLDACVLDAHALGLKLSGGALSHIDVLVLIKALAKYDVVIVPGFVALSDSGEETLLARGAADSTAVFLAAALGLDHVMLLQSAPGVIADSASDTLSIYQQLSFADAAAKAGAQVSAPALENAAAAGVNIGVSALNTAYGSTISAQPSEIAQADQAAPLHVCVAGLGVVGAGAALRVADDQDYRLSSAIVRNANKPREAGLEGVNIVTSADDALALAPNAVIDALPDGQAGEALINAALAKGVSVVSANKQAVAGNLAKFHEIANANDCVLAYGASVGGGAPMVETMKRARAAGEVVSFAGIMNGTVNFILDRMSNGASFDAAVKEAQDAGFAEPDPTADLSGEDTRAKISILTYHAFGAEIDMDNIKLEALSEDKANEMLNQGGVWKQMARVERAGDQYAAQVTFERVDDDPFFSALEGEGNALRVRLLGGGFYACKGRGAGRRATVESLLGDLGAIRRAER